MIYPVVSMIQVLQGALFPALARVQDDLPAFRRGYLRATGGIAMVTFPTMTGIGLVAAPFVQGVLGEKWAAAIPVMVILAPAAALQSLILSVNFIYKATGAPTGFCAGPCSRAS